MRTLTLNGVDGGISRLRNKGGAKPTELYDLLNGYVDASGAAVSRPGTEEITYALPAGATKGMCAFDGGLTVFSHAAQTLPSTTPALTCEILPHPTAPGTPIAEIHFAGPFLGHLYVVPEFADGLVRHYWLQSWGDWAANTVYNLGAVVEPTVLNGYAYKATRGDSPSQPWAPNIPRAIGDVVEPTAYNGYKYVVVDVIGANPTSGALEPLWPTIENATVIEEVDGATVLAPEGTDIGDIDETLPPDVAARYANLVIKAAT